MTRYRRFSVTVIVSTELDPPSNFLKMFSDLSCLINMHKASLRRQKA